MKTPRTNYGYTFLLLFISLLMLGSSQCEEKQRTHVSTRLFEFSFIKEGLSIHKLPPFEMLISPQTVKALGDSVYIGNVHHKEIYLFQPEYLENIETHALMEQEAKIVKLFNQQRTLDTMGQFTVSSRGEIYIENIAWEKQENERFGIGKKSKNWIYKISDQNEFLFKIGKEGMDSPPFEETETIYSMFTDLDHNLWVILQRFDKEQITDLSTPSLSNYNNWEVLVFSPKGRRIARWKPSYCESFFKPENNHYWLITDIQNAHTKNSFVVALSIYDRGSTQNSYPQLLSQRLLFFKLGPQPPYQDFEVYNSQNELTNTHINNKEGLTLWGITYEDIIIFQSPHIEFINDQKRDTGKRVCTFLTNKGELLGEYVLENTEINQRRYHFYVNPNGSLLSIIPDKDRILGKIYRIEFVE